jgi:hypothetical protein
VNVQAQAGAKTIVHPVELTVPSGGVSWVQIGGCSASTPNCLDVPSRAGYVLVVQSDADAPIVAQTLSRFEGDGDGTLGAATSTGSTIPSRRWVIPRTGAQSARSTLIALTDQAVDPAHVAVAIVYRGEVHHPAALRRLTVAPGERVVLPRDELPLRVEAAVVVTSDVPIFAESTIYADRDATRAPGVPAR